MSNGKDFSISMLLDFYSSLLSDSQRTCLELYYYEDYSLAEIAENVNMSRQGVLSNIKKGESVLRNYESKLNLAKQFSENDILIKEIHDSLDALGKSVPDIKKDIQLIIDKLSQIAK